MPLAKGIECRVTKPGRDIPVFGLKCYDISSLSFNEGDIVKTGAYHAPYYRTVTLVTGESADLLRGRVKDGKLKKLRVERYRVELIITGAPANAEFYSWSPALRTWIYYNRDRLLITDTLGVTDIIEINGINGHSSIVPLASAIAKREAIDLSLNRKLNSVQKIGNICLWLSILNLNSLGLEPADSPSMAYAITTSGE